MYNESPEVAVTFDLVHARAVLDPNLQLKKLLSILPLVFRFFAFHDTFTASVAFGGLGVRATFVICGEKKAMPMSPGYLEFVCSLGPGYKGIIV